MKSKHIQVGILILTAIGLLFMILNQFKSTHSYKNNTQGNDNTVAQTGNNSPVTIYQNVQMAYPDEKQIERLVEKVKKLEAYQNPFPDQPKIVIATPSVTVINHGKGIITARFDIPFLNIGGVDGENLTTKWTIYDDYHKVTGLNEWLKYINEEPLVIAKLPAKSNNARRLIYAPHIGADGMGTLKLTLDFKYVNSKTGEEHSEQYNGFVDYHAIDTNQHKTQLLTPYITTK
ncbi:MAG TPA: hypothetical protein ENH41_05495 [Candidatus Omnitrophica bacterium]|nr:hypothetical protein [Candidatus Omnitrophota bacterium]